MKKEREIRLAMKRRLYQAQDGICPYCLEPLPEEPVGVPKASRWSEDHVVPRAMERGLHENRLLVHRRCNEAKADRPPTGCELLARAWVWARMRTIP